MWLAVIHSVILLSQKAQVCWTELLALHQTLNNVHLYFFPLHGFPTRDASETLWGRPPKHLLPPEILQMKNSEISNIIYTSLKNNLNVHWVVLEWHLIYSMHIFCLFYILNLKWTELNKCSHLLSLWKCRKEPLEIVYLIKPLPCSLASAFALKILPLHAIVRAASRWLKTMATPVSALSSSRVTTFLSRRDSRGSTWGKVVSVGLLISERELEVVT